MKSSETDDTVVIGAGQAGLAVARALRAVGRDVRLLEAHDRFGHSWRRRWRGLRRFTPARYSSLPGLPFPADAYELPTGAAFADYLAAYAKTFTLDVVTGALVASLQRSKAEEGFTTHLTDGRFYNSRRVVVASGAYRIARYPNFAVDLPPRTPRAPHESTARRGGVAW